MAAERGEVLWYDNQVSLVIQDKSIEALAALAVEIEAQAKINIVDNDQVDTGFMLNSIYWKVGPKNTYESTWGSGTYDGESGPEQSRERAPQADLGNADGYVAVGAEYAIYQELQDPYLMPALQAIASKRGAQVKVDPF